MIRFLVGAALALAMAFPAHAAWHEASTDHFVVYSDEEPETLRSYATKLERFDKAMRVIRGLPDRPVSKANRVTVYVVKDFGQVARLAGLGGVGGFYRPRAGESLAVTPLRTNLRGGEYDDRMAILLHEYTHHFLFANFPNAAYPMWFSEGYADFASTAQFPETGEVKFGVAHPLHLRNLGYLRGRPLPIPKMVMSEFDKLAGDALYALYARGWLLMHYLHFEPSRKGQLARYLGEINKGMAGPLAAAQAFGDLSQLEGEIDAYRKRKTFMQFELSPVAIKTGPITIRALAPGEAATMLVRIRVKNNTTQLANSVAGAARRAANDYPSHPAAQIVLAEAEYDASNYAAAVAAADRALATDPKSVGALLIKGMAMMAQAKAAKSKDDKTWADVRRSFLRANKADPEDPRPLIQFYRSFAAAEAVPTTNAVAGLNYAFVLGPQDFTLRLMVARQHIVDRKASEAAATLQPVAFNPHGGDLVDFAAELIGLLKKGDTASALARWNVAPKPVKDAIAG